MDLEEDAKESRETWEVERCEGAVGGGRLVLGQLTDNRKKRVVALRPLPTNNSIVPRTRRAHYLIVVAEGESLDLGGVPVLLLLLLKAGHANCLSCLPSPPAGADLHTSCACCLLDTQSASSKGSSPQRYVF